MTKWWYNSYKHERGGGRRQGGRGGKRGGGGTQKEPICIRLTPASRYDMIGALTPAAARRAFFPGAASPHFFPVRGCVFIDLLYPRACVPAAVRAWLFHPHLPLFFRCGRAEKSVCRGALASSMTISTDATCFLARGVIVIDAAHADDDDQRKYLTKREGARENWK